MLSYGTIRRRYDQGLDSIIRLVTDLENRIEDLTAQHTGKPQRLIGTQQAIIKRLEQTINNKDANLIEAHQLNQQLQQRIRELERCLETDRIPPPAVIEVCRDSHNSNQPPSLDLPWKKLKRTRSLRKKSDLTNGGQLGHAGVTLQSVVSPNRIIVHTIDNCSQCQQSLASVDSTRFFRQQVFEIENGSLAVIEHRTPVVTCPACGTISKAQFPLAVKAPVQYGTSVLSCAVYLHLYQLLPLARTQEAMRDLFGCNISQASINRAARLCSDLQIELERTLQKEFLNRYDSLLAEAETAVRGSPTHKSSSLTAQNLLNRFIKNKAEILSSYQNTF